MTTFNPVFHGFTECEIDRLVEKQKVGNYRLAKKVPMTGEMKVYYVGRSDSDLNQRLHGHLGKYESFSFYYAENPKEAFEYECSDFHRFLPPDNKMHPESPKETDWTCPIPNCPTTKKLDYPDLLVR